MEPSSILDQIDRLRAQLPAETDIATRREMQRTIQFLLKQYRKAMRHHPEWYGLKSNVTWLILLFFAIVIVSVIVELVCGWQIAATAFTVGIIVLILVSAMFFLQVRAISQETYASLVSMSLSKLPWRKVGGEGDPHAKGVAPLLEASGKSLPDDSPKGRENER